jgi:hypothetical protein
VPTNEISNSLLERRRRVGLPNSGSSNYDACIDDNAPQLHILRLDYMYGLGIMPNIKFQFSTMKNSQQLRLVDRWQILYRGRCSRVAKFINNAHAVNNTQYHRLKPLEITNNHQFCIHMYIFISS